MNSTQNGKATFPPGAGQYAIPPIQQAYGVFNSGVVRVFRNPDEAFLTDRVAAESMLQDLAVMEPLNSRMLATALLPWHVECDDKTDPEQARVARELTRIIAAIPELNKLF